jgi:hypothetical protein
VPRNGWREAVNIHKELIVRRGIMKNAVTILSRVLKRGVVLVLVILFCGVSVEDVTADGSYSSWFGHRVTVMTQNVYIGADIFRVIEAGSSPHPLAIPMEVANVLQTVVDTDFTERAVALAAQIEHLRPDLIGLQEVSLIRTQSPGDFLYGNPTHAEDELLDYLSILLAALDARGLEYKVAAFVENADVELPMLVGFNSSGDPLFNDVRLTDFDVILARDDVEISNDDSRNYDENASIPLGTLSIEFTRGFVAVDATVRGRTYRFVNTHLELPDMLTTDEEPAQPLQAQQLIEELADVTIPIILVGDFNSSPVYDDPSAYAMIRETGYVDAWERRIFEWGGLGYTCCQEEVLRNEYSNLYERIDHIFVRNLHEKLPYSIVGPVFAFTLGDEQQDKTSSGMWPSDHAGVGATMGIPAFWGDPYWARSKFR